MARLFPATPQVFVGNAALLENEELLRARGISRVLRLHLGEAASCPGAQLPCDDVEFLTDAALEEKLAIAARALEASLAAASGVLPANDTEAGDSTDEEADDGIRIRVRVTRPKDEKSWGVKWHKNIFKQSQRLVVEDIVEDSILSAWNERQPHNLQLGYGDRLIRINGVIAEERPGSNSTSLMRAELQKEEMRAVFFRPGKGKRKQLKLPTAPGAVLICPLLPEGVEEASKDDALAAGACIAAAHRWLFRPPGYEEDFETLLGDLREASAEKIRSFPTWRDALGAVRTVKLDKIPLGALKPFVAAEFEEEDAPPEAEPVQESQESPGDAAAASEAEAGASDAAASSSLPAAPVPAPIAAPVAASVGAAASDAAGADESEAATAAQTTTVHAAYVAEPADAETDAHADEAPAEVAAEEEEADENKEPEWVYSCRKCGVGLFYDTNLLPHFTDGERKAARNWHPAEAAQGGQNCTSLFVEPMKWMGDLEGQVGKLACGNPRCKQKLGGFSWHGLPCSCGQWQSPAFQIHSARLDCMPAANRRARGPAPQSVFS